MSEFIEITAEESGERIDALLARMVPELTRSAAQRLIEEGRVTFSGAPVKKNAALSAARHTRWSCRSPSSRSPNRRISRWT